MTGTGRPRRFPRALASKTEKTSMNYRQLKLGAVTMGAGGPGHHYLWLDPGSE